MKIFLQKLERFPTAFALVFLSAGICFARQVDGTDIVSWSRQALIPVLGLLLLALKRGEKIFLGIVASLLFFLLGFHLANNQLCLGRDFQPSGVKHVVHATVSKMWASGQGFRVFIVESGFDVTARTPLPGDGRLFLRENPVSLCAGDRIAFYSRIRKPINRGNPGEYDWEIDCKSNGIQWLVATQGQDSVLLLHRGSRFRPAAILFQFREAMDRFLETYSGRFLETYLAPFLRNDSTAQVRGFLKGIILGDLGEVDPALYKSFADSGLIHVLSASGVHVAIVVLLSLFVVRCIIRITPRILLWIPRRKLGALASVPAMIVYCLLVEARVPAIRSTLMGLVIAGALMSGRKWNSFNSLALAALLVLLLYPLSVFTPSFQLSFAAVAGIFFVVPHLTKVLFPAPAQNGDAQGIVAAKNESMERVKRAMRPFAAVAFTSLAATLAVTPLILQNFHSFPVYTMFANLLTDLILTVALSLGLVAAVLGTGLPSLSAWLLAPAEVCTWLVIEVSSFFANLPFSTIRLRHMGIAEFLLVTGAALSLLWYLRNPTLRRFLSAGALALATFVVLWLGSSVHNALRVVFLNVGKGDAALVYSAGSRGLLIDGGIKTQYFDTGQAILMPFLYWAGARSLDGILITHPHMDHMGGILSVIAQVPPSCVWWNPIEGNYSHLEKIFTVGRSKRSAILAADRTREPIQLGAATLRFLNRPHPVISLNNAHRDENNSSALCRVDYGTVSFLFTGDLEREGEDELLIAGVPLRATVLKVGHHGGKNGTTRRFLEAIQPKIAVIPAECPPSGGLPNRRVLERLESAGVEIFWTGKDGAVTIETDGMRVSATTGRSKKVSLMDSDNSAR
ncbi:MAG: DNA internalization-related competence protein ComEC/Rec2 [Desulfomonilaceae bacterium]